MYHTKIEYRQDNHFGVQMTSASDKRVRGRLGVNISDGPGGAVTLGLKALALVDNISGSYGIS